MIILNRKIKFKMTGGTNLFQQKLDFTTLSRVLAVICLLGMTSISLGQGDNWTYKASMPTARGFLSGTVLDGKIYVVGGTDNAQLNAIALVEMYDPVSDTWTTRASMPEALTCPATCTYNGKIYVFGGASPMLYSTAKNTVFEYDPQTDTWTQKANMPHAFRSCGVAVLNDTIYLMGGGSVYFPPDSTVMAYHPLTESWIEKAPMPTARGSISACVVDGKIYAIGGTTMDYHSVNYKLVEVFDPATNTWTQKADMPTGRFGLGTCVLDGKIYAVGGWRGSGVLTLNEMYDSATDVWESKSGLQQKRFTHFLGSVGTKIYAIGGAYPQGSQAILLSSVEEYVIPSSTEANKAVIESWLKMWETADLAIADEIFATDFVSHIPHYPDAADLEGYKEEVARTPTSVPDFDATIEDMIADGDKVVGRFTASGTMQPYGVPYTNTWIVIFRFVGGKIVEEWWQFDLLGVQQQLGVITPGRPTPEDYTWGVPSTVTGDPGNPETNKAIALRDEELWNTGNLAIADEIFATDFVNHDPGLPNVVDLESYKAFIVVCFTSFPDFQTTVEDMVAEGDKVVTRRTVTATHQGEFSGIPPTGRQVTWTGMTIYRVANGKIVEAWWAYDALGLMQQLTTAVEEKSEATAVPTGYALSQNYPNPFNPVTMINYQLPVTSEVDLSVYNILGQRVATLVAEKQHAGSYKVEWDASKLASGVYLYQLEVQDPSTGSPKGSGQAGQGFVQTRKMLLLQ